MPRLTCRFCSSNDAMGSSLSDECFSVIEVGTHCADRPCRRGRGGGFPPRPVVSSPGVIRCKVMSDGREVEVSPDELRRPDLVAQCA